MAGHSSATIVWSWTDVSVLGSQAFGQALMDSCDLHLLEQDDPALAGLEEPHGPAPALQAGSAQLRVIW